MWIGKGSKFGTVPWRAIVMLSLATLLFAAFLEELGLGPCVFLSSMIAYLSTAHSKMTSAAIVSAAITAFCLLVFRYGIGFPSQSSDPGSAAEGPGRWTSSSIWGWD